MKKEKIIIVGAGLCGSLLAIILAQRGFNITLYEKREDIRNQLADAGRSINLALSARGFLALEKANLKEEVLKNCIPMYGRQIHTLEGNSFHSPYSGRAEDYINSVSRPGLNRTLLNAAEKLENIDIKFDSSIYNANLEDATIEYKDKHGNKHQDQGSVVIGTDGAGSVIRRSLMRHTSELLFNYSQNFLRHGYKELSIMPDENGQWQIDKNALHIWPNGNFMIIALPNLNGSFTLTMFHPYDGKAGFNTLNTEAKLLSFFETYYPSLLPYIPQLNQEYFENPVGTLGTIKCNPWYAFGKGLIMGDAAHAIVPFYGQGMNASLEDVKVFDDILETHGSDWNQVFHAFQEARRANTDAIADLAIDNFYEMRDHVDDQNFIRKRKIEMKLEQEYLDYYSKYSLVTFRPKIDYAEAMNRGRKQDEILLEMCSRDDFDQIPLESYYKTLINLNL